MSAYLDHAASTPMRPEAVDAMLPYLREHYGNPSGAHTMARRARQAIDEARDTMAEVLGAEPRAIVFTGGGTEADNLAVLGVHDRRGGVLIASAVEHHAVHEPVGARGGRFVGVDPSGVIDLEQLRTMLEDARHTGDDVSLVSVMLANNEVGVIQPLTQVGRLVRKHAPDALLHTDAVQAFPWLDVAALARPADLVSVSAHKFGGPKGVGVLVCRERVAGQLAARTIGGGQEQERRSGTQNVAAIVGMAVAARLTVAERDATAARVEKLRDRLADGVLASIPDVVETGARRASDGTVDRSHKVAGSCHVCVSGIESESLLFLLERAEIYASAASSCASGAMEPSHVLAAMGVSRPDAFGSLRLSLGWSSTDADVDAVLAALPPAVERLRAFS
jgi:cysteine desulfurase